MKRGLIKSRFAGKSTWALLLVVLLSFSFSLTRAQDTALSETDFWARMAQSQSILEGNGTRAETSNQLNELWRGVHQVQAADSVVIVDMSWLTQSLADDDTFAEVQQEVRALLDYHAHQTGQAVGKLSQSALDDVLKDPRFQYAQITPTPLPPPQQGPTLDTSAISPGLSQILLTAMGIIVVVLVFAYLASSLRIQRATLETPSTEDEPDTSGGASDRADDLAAAQDYRGAIRYLYLASLLLLNERGLIHYDSTLTNREHLRQVESRPQLLEALRRVVNIFEDVWYGYAPVDEAFYQHYRQQVDALRAFAA